MAETKDKLSAARPMERLRWKCGIIGRLSQRRIPTSKPKFHHAHASLELKKVKFEQLPPIPMLVTVKWLKTIAVFGLLGLWLAATNHCRLERIPLLSLVSCCAGGESSQDADCQTDGCASVEDGPYKTENYQVQVVMPLLAFSEFLAPRGDNIGPGHESVRPGLLNLAPPEFPKGWQFFFRAAAPPRAPSIVS